MHIRTASLADAAALAAVEADCFPPAEAATAAEITDIVFTGEICRITARAGGATLSLACINVQAEHYRPGQKVYVLADRSKTHYFKK